MEMPLWAEKIFVNEFDLPGDASINKEFENWVDQHIVGGSFDEFYETQVEDAEKTPYNAGQNQAYSIREEPFNCEGAAAMGAIAGTLFYDRNLEVLTEWNQETGRRNNPWQQARTPMSFNSHVALVDTETGEEYGSTSLFERPEVLDISAIAGIYLTNLADEARTDSNRREPEEYLDEIDHELSSQYSGARRSIIENRS